jgi:hypothetical protein
MVIWTAERPAMQLPAVVIKCAVCDARSFAEGQVGMTTNARHHTAPIVGFQRA